MRNRSRTVIGALVLIAGAIFIMLSGMRNSSQYFQTVSELKKHNDLIGKGLRVNGHVDSTTVRWDADSLTLRFELTDGAASLPVIYKGVAPDMFNSGESIVVEGKLGEDGVFHANNILVKCPSKYEPAAEDQTTADKGT